MFAYDEIKQFLTRQAQNLFEQDPALYNNYSNQAKEIIQTKTKFEENDKEWLKIPFAWIVEYLIINKFSALSEQILDTIKNRYDEAIRIIEERKVFVTKQVGKFGLQLNEYEA